jgi:hypothetical protein
VLLVVPALIEAARGGRGSLAGLARRPDVSGRVAAVVAPALGAALFLGYVGIRFGDALEPVRAQQVPGLRGHTVFPLVTVARAAGHLVTGDVGAQSHFPWVLVALALAAFTLVRWPASFGWYAALTVLLATAAQHLGSLERYAYGGFPIVLAAAGLLRSERAERAALVLSGAAMGAYAVAAFIGAYVP